MLSDEATALLINDKELTNDEISDLFDGCPGGVEARHFYIRRAHSYTCPRGRTAVRQVLCANARQKKKPHTINDRTNAAEYYKAQAACHAPLCFQHLRQGA